MPHFSRTVIACGLFLAASDVSQAQGASESSSLAPAASTVSPNTSRSVGVVNASFSDSVEVGQADTFLGPDKVRHFMMSGFIEAIGFNALRSASVDRGVSLGVATTVTFGIGVARELHDRRTKGLFSLGDLTWDTLGTAAALLVISRSQR